MGYLLDGMAVVMDCSGLEPHDVAMRRSFHYGIGLWFYVPDSSRIDLFPDIMFHIAQPHRAVAVRIPDADTQQGGLGNRTGKFRHGARIGIAEPAVRAQRMEVVGHMPGRLG